MGTFSLMGYEISSNGLEGDVESALSRLRSGEKGCFIACANPHSLVLAAHDPQFRAALHAADLLLPDGVGVVHAARLFGCSLPERVVGYDFFINFSARFAATGGGRYYFLGATEEALKGINDRLACEFPAITVCGSYSPPFSADFAPEENRRMVDAINRAKPDVLWVGMTAPKQEKWILAHRHALQVPCIGAIGAVFDFYSGLKQRSPVFWQRIGLEWLYRLCREPARLWERTVISAPVFVAMVVKEWLRYRCLSASPVCMNGTPQKKKNFPKRAHP